MPAPTKVTPLGGDGIARRIADYVNTHFDGNVSEACRAIGCTHDQLWRAATGRAKASLVLLTQLTMHSGKSADWWLTGDET